MILNSIPKYVGFLVVFALAAGCSTTHYRKSADKEAYSILASKTPGVAGMIEDVNIEPSGNPLLDGLPVNETLAEFLGTEAQGEIGASILSLEKALEIAYTYSRDYQRDKETLYLQALSLSLSRHQFAPIFSGGGSVFATGSTRLETPVQTGVSGNTGVSLLLKGGGRIALNLSATMLHLLKGDAGQSASSVLSGSFSQPLWRGAGRKVASENLTQAERSMIYAMRSFTRRRKQFTVQIATNYYAILQQRDSVRNTYAGLQSQLDNLERETLKVEVGLLKKAQLGRLEQNALEFEARMISATVNYKRSLDAFKILIGLSALSSVILDDDELATLRDVGITAAGMDSTQAIEIAMANRLDLLTERDGLADAERQIPIAANNLRPDLDFLLSSSVPNKPGSNVSQFDFDAGSWDASLGIGLPFDRKAERNNYRRSLINYEVAKRSLSLFEDNIRLSLRDQMRSLEQLARDYEIAGLSVQISQLTLDEVDLTIEFGMTGFTILDLVDSQNDFTAAQTALTGVLINHTIALLELWRDIGILNIDENGLWEDMENG